MAGSHDTPMMRQYLQAKAEHPGALLFMRMGDFYELFLDDAVEASKLLGITLTSRNKGAADEVPMAGVPHHALQQHLPKLLALGRTVAVMDQLEDPKEAKGLVKRGLTRIISAGTLLDEDALPGDGANYLVAISGLDGRIGVAALDCSTGHFTVEEADGGRDLALVLARLDPAELVLPERLDEDGGLRARVAQLLEATAPPIATLAPFAWHPADGRRLLCERLHVGDLAGFGVGPEDDHLVAAAAAALRYAERNTFQALGHVRRLQRLHRGSHLVLDATCRRNLELLRNARDGSRSGSLLAAVDRTRSAPGARLLAEWLSRPLANVAEIRARHEAVAWLHDDDGRRGHLREVLAEVYDLERLLARLATARAHARDLVQLASTLEACRALALALGDDVPPLLDGAPEALSPCQALADEIRRVLVDEPPLQLADGGLIRDGIDGDLDELRALKRDAGAWLAQYQAREAARCGLSKLKVGYNKVFGYYIELSKANAERVPPDFIRKQTLVGAERYITPELKEYEEKVLGADERARVIEGRLFEQLRQAAAAAIPELASCAEAAARIDVLASLAEQARLGNWCRPLIDDGSLLDLREARHPVVEQVLGPGRFVANDCCLDAAAGEHGRLAIITGPNMAGKSTYIRQTALAVVLAQAGSFVPAAAAHIGVVDRLFTRVGAGDELARNMSTFMVEMAETAAILNHASDRSLVILDEVGRGTSTFDGLSLAWAITEYLHDRTRCRCLFATHYHELCDLADQREGVRNLSVQVAEHDDEVVFLHRIAAGAAAKSYGIHVARLAGVPASVLSRAREVLLTLEELNLSLSEREQPQARQQGAVQLTLFGPVDSPALRRLREIKLDEYSPRQAQDELYRLQAMARGEA